MSNVVRVCIPFANVHAAIFKNFHDLVDEIVFMAESTAKAFSNKLAW